MTPQQNVTATQLAQEPEWLPIKASKLSAETLAHIDRLVDESPLLAAEDVAALSTILGRQPLLP
ncbi:hypothetical protein [Mycobacterium sp. Marseille-P9652]|uniref:hypothetical protein n=1 Tax=Mycobacterium sp. Marseille-P9652 TaxID=2654950 RepID=UPI0012E9668D|nr:hypothetical protein [Mycobacterium sp. Marseille-P9652]